MRRNFAFLSLLLFLIIIISGCPPSNGGGGGNGGNNGDDDCTPSYDATGTWSSYDTEIYDSDEEPLEEMQGSLIITQTSNNFSMETDEGDDLNGTVCGTIYTFTGDFGQFQAPTGEWGTASVEGTMELTSEITLEGEYTFTWTDGSYTHTEDWEVVGTKQQLTDEDPCDGPVPCATTDWGDTYYEFFDSDGYYMQINSNGVVLAGAGLTEEGYIMGLGGNVIDCNNSKIILGGMDYNADGIIDYLFNTATGDVNICGTILKVTNIFLDGVRHSDIVATYAGIARSAIQTNHTDNAQAIISETLDRLKEEN